MGSRVVINISPSRLDAVVYRGGRAVARESRRHDDAAALLRRWPDSLTTLLMPLSEMVAELNIKAGEPATIVYAASPSLVTNVSSCHIAVGEAAAADAAELSLANLSPFSLDDNVFGVQLLYSDQTKPQEDAPAMLHLGSAADTLATSEALAALARGAGLTPNQIIPAEALVLRAAVEEAVHQATEHSGTTAVLWVSDHGCVLAAAVQDRRTMDEPVRLAFARSINVGAETFVEALTKPLRVTGIRGDESNERTVTLGREDARKIFGLVGIPAPGTAIPGKPELSGSSLMPALNPVLQRLGVEIKQSLRFGLAEHERGAVRLVVAGGGRQIPHFSSAITRQSGIVAPGSPVSPLERAMEPEVPDESPSEGSDSPDSSDGFIDAVFPLMGRCVNLVPPDVTRTAAIVRIKQAMWVGVAAALGLIGFEAYSARMDLEQERRTLSSLNAQIAAAQDAVELHERAVAVTAQSEQLRTRLNAAMPDKPDWAALLAAISTITPDQARLTDITASIDETLVPGAMGTMSRIETARCRIAGYMPTDAVGTSASRHIDDYLSSLGALPIIESTQLGPTRLSLTQLGQSRSFEIVLTPVMLPPAAEDAYTDAQSTPLLDHEPEVSP